MKEIFGPDFSTKAFKNVFDQEHTWEDFIPYSMRGDWPTLDLTAKLCAYITAKMACKETERFRRAISEGVV